MAPTNEEIETAFNACRRIVEARFPPGIRRDAAMDRATTAFLNAVKKYRPDPQGHRSFLAYAIRCVNRSFVKIHGKSFASTSADVEQADRNYRIPQFEATVTEAELELLPPSIRNVVWLHVVLDFGVKDVGLLTGSNHQIVRQQLTEAVRILQA